MVFRANQRLSILLVVHAHVENESIQSQRDNRHSRGPRLTPQPMIQQTVFANPDLVNREQDGEDETGHDRAEDVARFPRVYTGKTSDTKPRWNWVGTHKDSRPM